MTLQRLRLALEKSWRPDTAYAGAQAPGNPALGQCYPTARVVQHFFPCLEIASGTVETGNSVEAHFWNVDPTRTPPEHVDLTWQQFPPGAKVAGFSILDRDELNDSAPTIHRVELLLGRVQGQLAADDEE